MAFQPGPVTVRAPASSANLGPGYDSFGLALSRYDEVTAAVTGAGLEVLTAGCGAGEVPADERHLVVRAMRAAFDRLTGQPPGLRVSCRNTIPHGRGLGSSAAAIVSGIALARALTTDGDQLLDERAALELATELEGHPDNVAACLLGGVTVAWLTADGAGRAVRLDPIGVLPVLLIPTDRSATEAARALLPATVPHADAAFNAGRVGLLVLALTGRPDLLFTATEDRLHQQYRAAGMPRTARLVDELRAAGLPAMVSGAGPSVLVLTTGQAQRAQLAELVPAGWACAPLEPADGVWTAR
ncbi:MAG TPA: homoserine kinase [Jatrophihabitans sp.]|nr:homoserine kinase [Jatrophihabitans sp.]